MIPGPTAASGEGVKCTGQISISNFASHWDFNFNFHFRQSDLPSQKGLDGLKLIGNSWDTCKASQIISRQNVIEIQKEERTKATEVQSHCVESLRRPTKNRYFLVLIPNGGLLQNKDYLKLKSFNHD